MGLELVRDGVLTFGFCDGFISARGSSGAATAAFAEKFVLTGIFGVIGFCVYATTGSHLLGSRGIFGFGFDAFHGCERGVEMRRPTAAIAITLRGLCRSTSLV